MSSRVAYGLLNSVHTLWVFEFNVSLDVLAASLRALFFLAHKVGKLVFLQFIDVILERQRLIGCKAPMTRTGSHFNVARESSKRLLKKNSDLIEVRVPRGIGLL